MKFTVVCYRPDGEDRYRESWTSSEFELHVEESADEAGERIAEKRFANHREVNNSALADWETTLLIDGAEPGYDDPTGDEVRDAVEVAAHAHLQRLIAEAEERKLTEQRRLEAVAAETLRKKNEAKERHDRAEFERLKSKFG